MVVTTILSERLLSVRPRRHDGEQTNMITALKEFLSNWRERGGEYTSHEITMNDAKQTKGNEGKECEGGNGPPVRDSPGGRLQGGDV